MPDITPNLSLKKPFQNENYDINIMNENMDTIDASVNKSRNQIKIIQNQTLLKSNWTLSGNYYKIKFTNSNITSNSIVDVNIFLEQLETAVDLLPSTKSFNGYVEIFATKIPSSNLNCDIKIVKEGI